MFKNQWVQYLYLAAPRYDLVSDSTMTVECLVPSAAPKGERKSRICPVVIACIFRGPHLQQGALSHTVNSTFWHDLNKFAPRM